MGKLTDLNTNPIKSLFPIAYLPGLIVFISQFIFSVMFGKQPPSRSAA